MPTLNKPKDAPSPKANPSSRVGPSVLNITVALSAMFFASMHRPEHPLSPNCDSKKIAPAPAPLTESLTMQQLVELRLQPTEQEMQELDAEIDSIFQKATKMAYAKFAYFQLTHPEPDAKDFVELMNTMPESLKPHIIRIAQLVALHPQEVERVQARVTEKIGIKGTNEKTADEAREPKDARHEASERRWQRQLWRSCAHQLLTEWDMKDPAFSRELQEVVNAEMGVMMFETQQTASSSK